ncbi:hypothetical protein BU17DRAFT_97313 [Hysterangium stoloniferum]|nr:hypothetical protein BU17DRAFT_97313 [Hysterangium stoloniferum]
MVKAKQTIPNFTLLNQLQNNQQKVEAKKSNQVSPKPTTSKYFPEDLLVAILHQKRYAPSGTISDGDGDDCLVGECNESGNENKDESVSGYEGEEEGRVDGLEPADGDGIDDLAEAKAMIAHLSQQLKATQGTGFDQFVPENRLKRVISQSFDVEEKHKNKKCKRGVLKLPNTAKLHDHIKNLTHHAPSSSTPIQRASSDSSVATTILASPPSTPPPTGLKPGAPPDKLWSYTPRHQKAFTQSKCYINLFIATQDAFPDHVKTHCFALNAISLAANVLGMNIPDTSDNELLVRNHFPNACGHWKSYSHAHIHENYKIIGSAPDVIKHVNFLLQDHRYIYGKLRVDEETGEVKCLKAFGHPHITALIHQVGFVAKDSPARLSTSMLCPIPLEMIVIACLAMFNSLSELRTSGQHVNVDMNKQEYIKMYQKILSFLDRMSKTVPHVLIGLQEELSRTGMRMVTLN